MRDESILMWTPDQIQAMEDEMMMQAVLEMEEDEWYEKVYRGDVPQLTIRAVVVGSVLGFLLAFTNLYIGLKTGWGLGVAITACILSYAFWNVLLKVGIAKTLSDGEHLPRPGERLIQLAPGDLDVSQRIRKQALLSTFRLIG